MLADKAYSTRKIRDALRRRGIKATIPEPSNQVAGRKSRGSKGGRPPKFDKEIYKTRNTVERAINRLRGYRAVATRYDKREFVYKGTIDVASIGIWLRQPADQSSGHALWSPLVGPNPPCQAGRRRRIRCPSRRGWCQPVMTTFRAFVSAARPKVS